MTWRTHCCRLRWSSIKKCGGWSYCFTARATSERQRRGWKAITRLMVSVRKTTSQKILVHKLEQLHQMMMTKNLKVTMKKTCRRTTRVC